MTTAPPETATTWLERRLYWALDWLNMRYEPQKQFDFYTADAYLPDYHVVVEADGCAAHACPACGYARAINGERVEEVERKARVRDRYFLRTHGIVVVHLWGHDLTSSRQAVESVRAALAGKTHINNASVGRQRI